MKLNGWNEYATYVLKDLDRLNKWCETLQNETVKQAVQIGQLQVKAGVWGAIGGAIPVVVMLFVLYMKGKL